MPKERRLGYTTIGIPTYVRDRLKEYGTFGESWADMLLRLLTEIEDARKIKERYRLK